MNYKQKHLLLEYQHNIYKQMEQITTNTVDIQDIYTKQCKLLQEEVLDTLPELIEAILEADLKEGK